MASIIVAFAAVQSRHLFPKIRVAGDHAVVPAFATRMSHFLVARGDDHDENDNEDHDGEDHDDEKHHTHHTSDTTTSMNSETGAPPCDGIPNLTLPSGVTCPVSTTVPSGSSDISYYYSATGSATVSTNDTRAALPQTSTTTEAASSSSGSSASATLLPISPIRLSSSTSPMPTLPPTSPPSSAPLSSPTGSSARESSPVADSSSIRVANHGGAIAGGVIGGIVFILLLVLAFLLFLRRRRRKRTPASAEFRDLNTWQQQQRGMSIASRGPLAAQTSMEHLESVGADAYGDAYDAPPPPFHPGTFSDPLFEKIQETRQAHINYGLSSQ